jgi:hypothetical protein
MTSRTINAAAIRFAPRDDRASCSEGISASLYATGVKIERRRDDDDPEDAGRAKTSVAMR